jgi:hypothetical protein
MCQELGFTPSHTTAQAIDAVAAAIRAQRAAA